MLGDFQGPTWSRNSKSITHVGLMRLSPMSEHAISHSFLSFSSILWPPLPRIGDAGSRSSSSGSVPDRKFLAGERRVELELIASPKWPGLLCHLLAMSL
jgi:hypothetical protein